MISSLCLYRCSKCLTKSYCSRECLLKDWEEKHEEFCEEDADERKVKGGSKARLEAGSIDLASGLEKTLRLADAAKTERVKKSYLEVKALCEKKDKARKENSKDKRGKK